MIRDLPFEVPTEPFLAKAAAERQAAAAAASARNNQGFFSLLRSSLNDAFGESIFPCLKFAWISRLKESLCTKFMWDVFGD